MDVSFPKGAGRNRQPKGGEDLKLTVLEPVLQNRAQGSLCCSHSANSTSSLLKTQEGWRTHRAELSPSHLLWKRSNRTAWNTWLRRFWRETSREEMPNYFLLYWRFRLLKLHHLSPGQEAVGSCCILLVPHFQSVSCLKPQNHNTNHPKIRNSDQQSSPAGLIPIKHELGLTSLTEPFSSTPSVRKHSYWFHENSTPVWMVLGNQK